MPMTIQPLDERSIQHHHLQVYQVPADTRVESIVAKSGDYLCLTHVHWRCLMLPGSTLTWPDGGQVYFPGEAIPPLVDAYQAPVALKPQQLITQAMILGAGLATRFEPLSGPLTGLPKPGVPLQGKQSVIACLAKHLYAHGIRHVIVNTFYRREVIKEQLSRLPCADLHVSFVDEEAPSGTAGGLVKALEAGLVNRDMPMLIMQGDAVTNADISALLRAHPREADATLGVKTVPDAWVPKMAIVRTLDSANNPAQVSHYQEKPTLDQAGESRLGSIGFYVLSPKTYPSFCQWGRERWQTAPDYDYALHYFPRLLMQARQLMAYRLPEPFFWSDMGQPKDYLATVHSISQGNLTTALLTDPPTNPELRYHNGVVYWPGAWPVIQQAGITVTGNAVVMQNYPTAG